MTKRDTSPTKRVYGRRQGRPLNASRLKAVKDVLPAIEIPTTDLTEAGNLSPDHFFETPFKETWFEIGFGAGEHLSALLRRHPDTGYFGAEPYINGMASFIKDIQDAQTGDIHHNNIRVLMDDAMMLANSLSESCLDGIYVLNPDPWHKKRHHKRRIINQNNLDCFARILKPGAQLIMSTDVPDLADWMVTEGSLHPDFEWQARCASDWSVPPDDWITTAYEIKKAKGADKMVYLFFVRK